MKQLLLAILASLFTVSSALAETACETKAVGADGKPLAGAAKTSFLKKCKADACEAKRSAPMASRSPARRRRASSRSARPSLISRPASLRLRQADCQGD